MITAQQDLSLVYLIWTKVCLRIDSSKKRKRSGLVRALFQTFPYAVVAILQSRSLKENNFTVVIDEAHNSQAGQAASKLRAALTPFDLRQRLCLMTMLAGSVHYLS